MKSCHFFHFLIYWRWRIHILNRRGGSNLQDVYSVYMPSPNQKVNYLRQYYNGVEHFDPASPIRRDNAYSKSCSKRKRKYWVLHRKYTFKLKITTDRHNGRQNLIYCLLPVPRHFSLPSTFNELYYIFLVCLGGEGTERFAGQAPAVPLHQRGGVPPVQARLNVQQFQAGGEPPLYCALQEISIYVFQEKELRVPFST